MSPHRRSTELIPTYWYQPGAIIPKQPLAQSSMEAPKGALQLDVYSGSDCRGSLPFHDRSSSAYKKGVFLLQGVTCGRGKIAFSHVKAITSRSMCSSMAGSDRPRK